MSNISPMRPKRVLLVIDCRKGLGSFVFVFGADIQIEKPIVDVKFAFLSSHAYTIHICPYCQNTSRPLKFNRDYLNKDDLKLSKHFLHYYTILVFDHISTFNC